MKKKKIYNLIEIIYNLLFNKKSYFRNAIINNPKSFFNINEKFNKLITLELSENKIFNGQVKRKELIENILKDNDFDFIIETGTYLGNTTIFLQKFNIPVLTTEINDYFYRISKLRFEEYKNIALYNMDSLKFLKKIDKEKDYFIYLDAHWYKELPLDGEIKILSDIENQVIVIDDFKIPDKPEWGYDVYNDIELSLNNISIPKKFKIFFPDYNVKLEKFHNRGYLIMTSGEKYYNSLKENNNLKEYELRD